MLFLEGMSSKGCEEKGQFVLDASTAGAAKESCGVYIADQAGLST